jgi:hypothetical protein
MKRTLENCSIIKKFGEAVQYDGKCEGLGKTDADDETCDVCKKCKLYIHWEVENE